MKKVLKIIGIVVLVIIILLLLVVVGGFAYLYFNGLSGMQSYPEVKEGQIKVACIGDSTTYGHGISNWPKNNYPVVLSELLGDEYVVHSYGVSGRAVQDDSDQPYTALEHYTKSLDYDSDIIVFMMGSNDSKPENWHDATTFKTALCKLLDTYVTSDNPPIIYLCTPATVFFTEGYSAPLAQYDIQPAIVEEIADIVREISNEKGYSLIDINNVTKTHPEWFSDGVHPTKEGAAAIADTVYQAITNP